jgi:N-acetylneuraminic acid mutarotase
MRQRRRFSRTSLETCTSGELAVFANKKWSTSCWSNHISSIVYRMFKYCPMRLNPKICYLLLLLTGLWSCLGSELDRLAFVEVLTTKPRIEGLGKVTLLGEIKGLDLGQLNEYGFLYTTLNDNPQLNVPNVQNIKLGTLSNNQPIQSPLLNLPPDGGTYYVRAYALYEGREIYGQVLSFSFEFAVLNEANTFINGNQAIVQGGISGLSNLRDVLLERGHIVSTDSSQLRFDTLLKAPNYRLARKKDRVNDDGPFLDTLNDLPFNTRFYSRTYAITAAKTIVYGKKTVAFDVRDGWRRIPGPGTSANEAVGFNAGGRGYFSMGCPDQLCDESTGLIMDLFTFSPPATDTSKGVWKKGDNFLPFAARQKGVAFSIGEQAFVGLGQISITGLGLDYYAGIWRFDPAGNAGQGAWTRMDNFPGVARSGACAFVIGSKAYVGSGERYDEIDNDLVYFDDFYEFNPQAARGSQWKAIAAVPFRSPSTGLTSRTGRSGAVAFAIGNNGYVATGRFASTLLKDCWRYNPQTNAWSLMQDLPNEAGVRYNATGFSLRNRGFISGGEGFNSAFYRDLWEFNPSAGLQGAWEKRANFPGLPRSSAYAFTVGERAFVGGGNNILIENNQLVSRVFNDFYTYVPRNN